MEQISIDLCFQTESGPGWQDGTLLAKPATVFYS